MVDVTVSERKLKKRRKEKGREYALGEQVLSIDQMWEEYWKGRENGNGVYYRNKLVEHYRDLVKYCAERLHRKLPDRAELDDLISAGILGLIKAIYTFDPFKNVKFETYCEHRIKGSILDGIRKMDWVPRMTRARANQVEQAKLKIREKFGREPNEEELIKELSEDHYLAIPTISINSRTNLKLTGRKKAETIISDVRNKKELLSLSSIISPQNGENLSSTNYMEDKKIPNPLLVAQKKELKEILTKGLTRAEKLILVLYYYEEMTMKEIGKVLGYSKGNVNLMHSSIMVRLSEKFFRRKKSYLEEIFS